MVWTCSKNGRGKINQNKWWNGVHQEEENEVDLNLPERKGLEDWWEKKKGLMEEDWNDRGN